MIPFSEYPSAEDRPLNTYLNYSPMEELSGRSRQTSEDLHDDYLDVDLESLMEMSDTDLMFQAFPNSIGDIDQEPRIPELLGIANYPNNQFMAIEDRISAITEEVANEPPPTPTIRVEKVDDRITVTAKRTSQNRRKPTKRQRRSRPRNRGNRSIHLWEFLKEMLNNSEENQSYIKWISKRDGIFQLVNSSGVAKLWGQRKNRKNMTYEKMSRALRYYYEKDILERVPNARLIYKFGGKTRVIATQNSDESLSDSSEN